MPPTRQKNGGQATQALGRSRGGFSTKIHISVDALGNPLRIRLTGGQVHDITEVENPIDGLTFERLIADRGYDADPFRVEIVECGAEAVIPGRSNRRKSIKYDKHLYKERHLIECFINKIKLYRQVFSRFDKLASRYLGFLSFVATLIWLK